MAISSALCHQFDSQTTIFNLEGCCPGEIISCLTVELACAGCAVIPQQDDFWITLDNAGIRTNLENDTNFDEVVEMIHATEADLLGVAGIGGASVTAIRVALDVYNLGLLD